MDQLLINFKPVFFALKDINVKIKEETTFNDFWNKCQEYLAKIGYGNITLLMEDDGLFRRSSYNHWTKAYQRQPEGLDHMMKAFKACFGIIGNEDYCQVKYGDGLNYSWQKMIDCIPAQEETVKEFEIEERNPEDYQWSEETKKKLETMKEKLKKPDTTNA